jgi:hypothetical protein
MAALWKKPKGKVLGVKFWEKNATALDILAGRAYLRLSGDQPPFFISNE